MNNDTDRMFADPKAGHTIVLPRNMTPRRLLETLEEVLQDEDQDTVVTCWSLRGRGEHTVVTASCAQKHTMVTLRDLPMVVAACYGAVNYGDVDTRHSPMPPRLRGFNAGLEGDAPGSDATRLMKVRIRDLMGIDGADGPAWSPIQIELNLRYLEAVRQTLDRLTGSERVFLELVVDSDYGDGELVLVRRQTSEYQERPFDLARLMDKASSLMDVRLWLDDLCRSAYVRAALDNYNDNKED